MSCSVCSAHSRLFHCPTCARNQLYQLRIDNTQVLLEKEDLQKQVEAVQSPLRTIENDHAESLTRKELLERQLQVLRPEVEARKAEINRRKEVLARRRSDAESANHQLAERETGMLASAQNTSKRVEHVWHSLHSKTAESRIYLCREVANLYGLQKIKSQGRETYMLGCGFIVDLRDINGKSVTRQPIYLLTFSSHLSSTDIYVSFQHCSSSHHCFTLSLIETSRRNYVAPQKLPCAYDLHPASIVLQKPVIPPTPPVY